MLDQQISRRKLFRNSVLLGAGILLGHGAGGVKILNAQEVKKAKELDISLYIKIFTDNTVQLILPNIEMGQGIHTAQAMVIAEELGVNLDNIFVSNAPPLPEYGKRLSTAGSASMNKNFDKLIKIGATAREMLIEAASLEWRVHRDECVAKGGYVSHLSTGRSFSYGELTEKASNLVPPQDPRIKNRKEYQLIGQEIPRIDIPEKVNGSAVYGMDVRLPDMLFAVVKSAPRRGGKLMEFNEDEAMKVKGVKAVVRIPEKRVYLMEFPESIAVVAGSNWQAMKGMERLSPEFSGGNSEE
ncbi:MAG: molybdopterin cofactor-binding domain-containing protein, partial [Deltaproteobacteria bacterium]